MQKYLIPLFIVALAFGARAQTFDAFVARVYSAPQSEQAAIVDSFMAAVPSFPYIESDSIVHLIYRGTTTGITVAGDANEWSATANPMSRLSNTDLWFMTHNFENDARLDYKYVLGGSNWITDPRNTHFCTGGFGPNSELRMPQYVQEPLIDYNATIPHGTIRDTLFASTNLGNSRHVRIYTPAGYDSMDAPLGIVLFHDGLDYLNLGNAQNILDNMIFAGRIMPVIAIFVPPVDRTDEYAGNLQNAFTAFIVSELLPYVDSAYHTRTNPRYRATLGASYGGNIALWLGYSHPEVFGCVAAQSSYIQPNLISGFQTGPFLDLRIYMDLGTYDLGELIPLVRGFVPILEQRGYAYRYHEYHEGHSWCNWRARVDDALLMFFGADSTNATEPLRPLPGGFSLAAYPNPFNATTTLSYAMPQAGRVQIVLYDVNGRQVKVLEDSVRSAGPYQLAVSSEGLASGVYFVHLKVGELDLSQKIVLLK
jgi:enterochelin esterase-like enzyme